MRALSLWVLLLTSTVFSQDTVLTVVAGEAYLVSGAADLKTIGSYVFLQNSDTQLDYKKVGLVRVTTEAANVDILASDKDRNPIEIEKLEDGYYQIRKHGTFWIDITALDFEKNIYRRVQRKLVIGDDVKPPGPGPGPTPEPEPEPPTPAPIPEAGLNILFVAESSDATKMTPGQREILFSLEGRNFLTATCGNNWRAFDQHVQFTDQDGKWAKAIQRPRESLPWIIISNGTTGFEGPMPGSLVDLKKLVEEYK